MGHREAIRRKRPGMLSDGVILLHDNAHAARKTQELPRMFKWEVWTSLSEENVTRPNGCKIWAVQERDFHQAMLNKFVLCSDKC
ncbi:hypothetical protein AVEN_194975-1 [Araneus ventricosus]|uniref:Uncharacterized protein n=1 Tax=Araneus ventricosus TaxID=182803 RepID=A0A4Y2WYC3_ARAVE|nr:hypothetical protein AVEN_194975-1 [Araneus ventricosus]